MPETPSANLTPAPPAPQGHGGLAIASLISSCLGIFTCGLGSLVGLILGIVALCQAKPRQPKGLAIAGVAVGGAYILLVPILLIPVLSQTKQIANMVKDSVNVGFVSLAETRYAQNHPDQPVTLEVLLKESAVTPTQLISGLDERPAAKTPVTPENAAQTSSFILVPGFENQHRHAVIAVFVDPTLEAYAAKKTIPVAYEDNATEQIPLADLEAKIQKQTGMSVAELVRKQRAPAGN